MALFHEMFAGFLLVILRLWLQCAGLVALIFWLRHVVAGDLHKLGPFRSAALILRLTAGIIAPHGVLILFWILGCVLSMALLSWESLFTSRL